jgi:hypothetical protein
MQCDSENILRAKYIPHLTYIGDSHRVGMNRVPRLLSSQLLWNLPDYLTSTAAQFEISEDNVLEVMKENSSGQSLYS